MRTNRNLLAVAAVIIGCIAVVWFSTSTQGSEKIYELRPQIGIPEYRTDAARAIDAYERLMERYMDMTEMNLSHIGTALDTAVRKLDSIDTKLTRLSARMAKIEKALGIEPPKPPAAKKHHTKEAHNKAAAKCPLTPEE
jgi:hypothetical protein